jgi:hypothetical protein
LFLVRGSGDDAAGVIAVPAPSQRLAMTKHSEDHLRRHAFRWCGILIYCPDYKCSHWTRINGDQWPDHTPLTDLKDQFVWQSPRGRSAREAG